MIEIDNIPDTWTADQIKIYEIYCEHLAGSDNAEAVEEFEQDDELSGLPISTPPYTICSKCNFEKCVPLNYKSKRGYHHVYKDN